jgi:hypothetical protein
MLIDLVLCLMFRGFCVLSFAHDRWSDDDSDVLVWFVVCCTCDVCAQVRWTLYQVHEYDVHLCILVFLEIGWWPVTSDPTARGELTYWYEYLVLCKYKQQGEFLKTPFCASSQKSKDLYYYCRMSFLLSSAFSSKLLQKLHIYIEITITPFCLPTHLLL